MKPSRVFLMCSSTHNVQFWKKFCSLIEKLSSSKMYFLTTRTCKEVDSIKDSRLMLGIIGETQLEMEL